MTNSSKSRYLATKILTASQPQLQVILLDGALRFGRQAQELWAAGADFAQIDSHLSRMADVVDELTHAAAEGATEVSRQLEEQYAFIYRELAACRINQATEKLDVSLQLLQFERETWKLASERLEAEAASTGPRQPHMPIQPAQPSGGFSVEA